MTNQLTSLEQRDYFYLDPFWSVNLGTYIINWSIASSMSSKLEPVIWLRDTGHIGIHKRGGRTRTSVPGRHCLTSLKFKQLPTKILELYSNRQNSIEFWVKNIKKAFK